MDIFVGSIPFKFTDKNLEEIFSAYGKVNSVKVVIDKRTRQNKGFGFVEMPDRKQGMRAIAELNGSAQEGRAIIVSEAQKNKNGEKNQPRDWFKKSKISLKEIVSWDNDYKRNSRR